MRKVGYFLIFFLFISLTTMYFWFKEHAILFLGDEPFIYNSEAYLFHRSFSWLEISGGCLSTPVSAYYISLWYYAIASLGFPAWLIQAITFFLLLFLQFCSVFILNSFILKSKFPKETLSIYVSSFLGSLVYVFNTYQMTTVWIDLKGLAYSAAFYPLFLYSILRTLSNNKDIRVSKLKYALIGAISLFFTVWGTPKIWIPLVIYTIGFVIWGLIYFNNWRENESIRAILRRACNRYLILMSVVSSLLLIPVFLTVFLSLTSISPSYTLPKNIETYEYILKVRSKDTTLINTFHFWGMNMLNEPVASHNKILENMTSFAGMPINQLVLFIPLILIFSSLLLKKRLIRKFIILHLLLLIIITEISIIHTPLLRDVYLHIYRTTHILTVFNEPWSNFGLFYILLVSLLIAISIFLFILTSKSAKFYLVILLLFLYLIPIGYLFISGKFIPQEGLFNSKVKVPDYVLESLEFIESRNSQSKNKILILPYFKGKEVSNWEWNYWGYSVLVWLTKEDVIGSGYYIDQNVPLKILSEIQNKEDLTTNSQAYINILRILGVRWVVVREDMRWIPLISKNKPDIDLIENILSQFSINVSEFGKIKVFELLNPTPPVYLAERVVVTNFSNTSIFISNLNNIEFGESNIALVDEKLFDTRYISKIYKINKSDYHVSKLNPTKYKIHVYKSEGPTLLVLLQNYDRYWSAYVIEDGKKIKVPEENHFVVNGFANGWYINKTNSLEVELYYEPQKYYEIGLTISKVAFATCLILLIVPERKLEKFTRKKERIIGQERR
jgi:hypothetical protein